jgi:HK97 family phage major capsid protein
MTLATALTGDQPRSYSSVVAMVPAQLLNVADLVQGINIEGGTYTFPRETGSEGSISTQTEGSDKSQIDYDLTMVDANTDFIAGFAVYSKKMANNLPFLESFLPVALRRDYWKAENSAFNTILAAGATASTQGITSSNKVQMLIGELATLEGINFAPNAMVVTPADFYDILITEKSTGAGYGLPGAVTFENGQLRINGIPVFKATWLTANKYFVGDFTTAKKIITQGLGVEFSDSDEDNFRKNNITARVEAQVTLTMERPDSIIYGDFTAT